MIRVSQLGHSPLHKCAEKGNFEMAKELMGFTDQHVLDARDKVLCLCCGVESES